MIFQVKTLEDKLAQLNAKLGQLECHSEQAGGEWSSLHDELLVGVARPKLRGRATSEYYTSQVAAYRLYLLSFT